MEYRGRDLSQRPTKPWYLRPTRHGSQVPDIRNLIWEVLVKTTPQRSE